MTDPFSIVVGAASLADICIRLTQFIKEAKDGFQKVDQDLEDLSKELAALSSVSDLIKRGFEAGAASTLNLRDQQIVNDLWQTTRSTLTGCQDLIERLSALISQVLGNGGPRHSKSNSLRKYLRQQSKEGSFVELRRKLNAHQTALQTSVVAVNLIYTRNSQSTSNESFAELSKSIANLGADLEAGIISLQANIASASERDLDDAVRSAQNVVTLASLNKHFYTPQTVSSIFTGRETDLDTLRHCLLDPGSTKVSNSQKRFVVYGLPGSGKTQFCCKFASDNKQNFWGIFWIDGSSSDHAKQSFSTIARVGKVEPNERAAKSWLSSLGEDQPWLLIIDNADEASFPVEQCFPDGDSGIILITTRNPMLKVLGTVGPRHYHFGELGERASIELLLRAADEPMPWSQSTLDSAKEVCKTLGYLPLALLHAGKTILSPVCTLENYLIFFERNWNRIRKMKSSNNVRLVSDANATIYSSYELIHDGIVAKATQAAEDALDLLKIFSFLHRQRIQVAFFLRAASNPRLEMLDRKRREQEETETSSQTRPKPTWGQKMRNLGIGMMTFLLNLGSRPVLPRMLQDALVTGTFDEMRFRDALKELYQMSLIYANPDPKDESYSMHPAVHLWVRERPEMTVADQAVWCQATATILTQAILLPPLGDREEDEILRRDLLPHITQVQDNERAIRAKFVENQESRKRIWPVLQPRFDRAGALQLVKFSIVYSQGDQLEKAEKLQLQVADFAVRRLGLEHTSTMDIMLLLSSTYWKSGRGDEAADLQQRVLEACIRVRGEDDLKTLKIMDAYGSSRWAQGRLVEALEIHRAAVEGLTKLLGDSHVDTLRAMGNLGRALGKNFRFTEVVKVHLKVVSGLHKQLGPSHLDTLIAIDNLAMAYFDRAAFGYGHPRDLDRAADMEQEVFDQRKEKLGREHIYTLWAGLNLARIKGVRGEVDEALAIFLPGHAIARRNLGKDHFGVLFGELNHGRLLMYAKRYQEAETVLLGVTESHKGPRRGHPDRMLAIFSLIKCRNLLGKQEETIVLLDELTETTKNLFGEDHAWVKYLLDPQNLSKEPDDDVQTPITPVDPTTEGIAPVDQLVPVAMVAKYGHI